MSCKYGIFLSLAISLIVLLPTTSSAQPSGALRELVESRTSHAKYWLNEDGTKTAEIFAGPIHYQDAQGVWQEIDNYPGTDRERWLFSICCQQPLQNACRTMCQRLADG